MTHFKKKIKTAPNSEKAPVLTGSAQVGYLTVEGVYYSNINPSQCIHLYDADGDEFMFPIPGQAEPKPTSPEIAITVELPLYYLDEDFDGENDLIIWGRLNDS